MRECGTCVASMLTRLKNILHCRVEVRKRTLPLRQLIVPIEIGFYQPSGLKMLFPGRIHTPARFFGLIKLAPR